MKLDINFPPDFRPRYGYSQEIYPMRLSSPPAREVSKPTLFSRPVNLYSVQESQTPPQVLCESGVFRIFQS